jgi:leucyl/phenylalanyl-tRNA--protein transferase
MADDRPDSPPWNFPPAETADEHGLVAVGADLEPETLAYAYKHGLFPMPVRRRGPMAWWSPDPRAIVPLDGLIVSRSLARSLRRYDLTIDAAFDQVLAACAEPNRPHGWIDARIAEAYRRLHRLGIAHSVECWLDGRLVGGLYGVSYGGLFAGESMFHTERDASKVALVHLVELLAADGLPRLLDVQWLTPHLASLGAVAIPRSEYLALLDGVLPTTDAFDAGG